MVVIKRLSTVDADFTVKLDELLAFEAAADEGIERTVIGILADVKSRGDAAVLDYTNKFDRLTAASMADLELSQAEMQTALDSLPAERRAALEAAAHRVRVYHEKQRLESWSFTETDGTMLGQMVTPLDRVGLYVPGGKAAYPSSVLMNAIPAKVAGVKELIMVVPTPSGEKNQLVLAAACLAGVDRVFTLGGAQAVGALAYGTQTVPQATRSSGRAMPTWQRPNAGCSVSSASTWWPGLRKFWWWLTVLAIRTGWRWICSRRPSTMNWRNPS
jgi:histidinol dehydrogenase